MRDPRTERTCSCARRSRQRRGWERFGRRVEGRAALGLGCESVWMTGSQRTRVERGGGRKECVSGGGGGDGA